MTEREASLLERDADRARFLAVPDNADALAVAARYARRSVGNGPA
jgi:hypothetical protein